jgi:Cu+-exporting ATPase
MTTEGDAMARDPVCGMEVQEASTERLEYVGTGYVFCGADCKNRFLEEPDMYTGDPGMGKVADRDG